MGAWPRRPGNALALGPRSLLLALALWLCCLLAQPQPSRASFFIFGVRTSAHVGFDQQRGAGGGGREEKVPMTVVVPDYSPRPAPLGPAPSAAPAPAPAHAPVPASGSDGGGGGGGDDEDGTPRLPSERRSTGAGAPSSADHRARSQAPAAAATSADFISSSPAVPLPAGVTDSATVLPMPTPGGHQLQDDVGMGTLRLQVTAVQLAVPLLMMLSFGATSVSVRRDVL